MTAGEAADEPAPEALAEITKGEPRGRIRGFIPSLVSVLTGHSFPMDEFTWFECKLEALRNNPWLGFLNRTEEEDKVTRLYVDAISALERSQPPYLLTDDYLLNQYTRFGEAERGDRSGEGHMHLQYPLFGKTRDAYQFLTWKWLRKRVLIEDDTTAKHSLAVAVLCVLQLMLSAAILGLGTLQADGGNRAYLIAAFFIGICGIVSSGFGAIGAMAQNESFLRRFVTGQLWLIALLASYLYITLEFIVENERQCSPSLGDLAATGDSNCDSSRTELALSIVLCLIDFCACFGMTFLVLELLDGLNDKTVLSEELMMFKFFQRKLDELNLQLQPLDGE